MADQPSEKSSLKMIGFVSWLWPDETFDRKLRYRDKIDVIRLPFFVFKSFKCFKLIENNIKI